MKRVIKIKWKNLIVMSLFLASISLLMHDAYILSIGNLFSKYTISLTAYGCVLDLIAMYVAIISKEFLGGK